MHQSRHRTLVVFAQWIVRLTGQLDPFTGRGHHALAQRMARHIFRDQAGIIRGNAQGQLNRVVRQIFIRPQGQDLFEPRIGVDPAAYLPLPVMPVPGRGAGEELLLKGPGFRVEFRVMRGCGFFFLPAG